MSKQSQSGETQNGVCSFLADNLRDPDKADAVWKVLVSDGVLLSAQRSRRNKAQLVRLLASHGFDLLPPKERRVGGMTTSGSPRGISMPESRKLLWRFSGKSRPNCLAVAPTARFSAS